MMHERVVIDPAVMFGKPVIKGTRITIELILRKLAGGMTIDEILRDHPHLTPDDIYAAAAFAADYVQQTSPPSIGENSSTCRFAMYHPT